MKRYVLPLLVTLALGVGFAQEPITIGSKIDTEGSVLAQIIRLLLEQEGYTVDITSVSAREVYLPALERGEVDVVPEYAATLAEYLNKEANGPQAPPIASNDAEATVAAMQPLTQAKGLVLLEPAQAQDSNGYYVAKTFADEHDLTTLTDLGALGQPVTIAAGDECMERPFCAPGLTTTYGIEVTGVTGDGFGSLTGKQKVLNGQAQLGTTGTTDGTLPGLGLVLLEDDKKLQAADNLIPLCITDHQTKTFGDWQPALHTGRIVVWTHRHTGAQITTYPDRY